MKSKKIGLALSGGGARGFSHIGALKVLERHGIPIDIITGTSAGSIIGAAVAAGMTAAEIEVMTAKAGWADLTMPSIRFGGLLSNAALGRFLRRHLPVSRIEELNKPYAAIAFDLETNTQTTLSEKGDLITAIRASCAVPGIFTPVKYEDGRMLVDGGVSSPLPVATAREMGSDIVIAVDLISSGATFRSSSRTSFGVMIQGALSLLKVVAQHEQKGADVVIVPEIAHLRPDQINKRAEFISLGEKAAEAAIPRIKELIQ